MFRLIAPLLLAVLLWWGLGHLRRKYDLSRTQFNWLLAIAGLFVVVIILIAAGRAPVQTLLAPLAALVSYGLRYLPWLLRLLPFLRDIKARAGDRQQDAGGPSQQPAAGRMSVEEARAILGVDGSAGRDEIMAAHRRLMQKIHPDHGGSSYLAQRLNEARDRLLDELP